MFNNLNRLIANKSKNNKNYYFLLTLVEHNFKKIFWLLSTYDCNPINMLGTTFRNKYYKDKMLHSN